MLFRLIDFVESIAKPGCPVIWKIFSGSSLARELSIIGVIHIIIDYTIVTRKKKIIKIIQRK